MQLRGQQTAIHALHSRIDGLGCKPPLTKPQLRHPLLVLMGLIHQSVWADIDYQGISFLLRDMLVGFLDTMWNIDRRTTS